MNVENKFDFIIFGASGFTGKLVVEYALEKYTDDKSVSWAIAGRNKTKLHQLKDEMNIPDDVGIFIVESDDQNSIEEMLAQTKCVLTTVGPYQLYGEKLIRSCIASGTDYVDLCGEPGFMHKIISDCSAEAKQNGSLDFHFYPVFTQKMQF